MAWWQKKILRYALSRTGLLDDTALDLDNLDITFGKKNVVELKDVALNITRLSRLAQLPPSLRVETARILSLRLTVPADIYQSSIVAEVDGVELGVRLDEIDSAEQKEHAHRVRPTGSGRIPQHRKVHRRTHSPPPFDPGGAAASEDASFPTAEGLAKSFLLEEPDRDRRALEASVSAMAPGVEESILSESSEGDDIGTGAAMGLPGFLAGFLQGVVDRLQVVVKNVEIRLDTEVSGDGSKTVPVTLSLRIGSAALESVGSIGAHQRPLEDEKDASRTFKLANISLDLSSEAFVFDQLSQLTSPASPVDRRLQKDSPFAAGVSEEKQSPQSLRPTSASSTNRSFNSPDSIGRARSFSNAMDASHASILTADADRFADAGEDHEPTELEESRSDLDIQPGDDNFSWGSRRSRTDGLSDNLWNSVTSDEGLQQSILFEPTTTRQSLTARTTSPNLNRRQRDSSPYHRSLQSPGSWPTLEESPERNRSIQSPGSWPTFEEPQSSSVHVPSLPGQLSGEDSIDNKRAALETSTGDLYGSQISVEGSMHEAEDLSTSRFFTHEEAQSMYMSAMSQSVNMQIPGGWGSEDASSRRSASPEISRNPPPNATMQTPNIEAFHDRDLAYGVQPYSTPGNATPQARAQPPVRLEGLDAIMASKKLSRRILHVDVVNLSIPTENGVGAAGSAFSSARSPTANLPGTFSAYSEASAYQRQMSGSSRFDENQQLGAQTANHDNSVSSSQIKIECGVIRSQVDMSCGRLLLRLAFSAAALFGANEDQKSPSQRQDVQSQKALRLSVSSLQLALRKFTSKVVDHPFDLAAEETLLVLSCENINLATQSTETNLEIGGAAIHIGVSKKCLVAFNADVTLASSVLPTSERAPDIALAIATNRSSSQHTITEIGLETLPLELHLDLLAIDETFENFGGLSGIFEAGNSILSESGMTSPSLSPTKPTKGVRFEDHSADESPQTELKFNARVGGLLATLKGANCLVELQTSTLRAIYREHGVSARVEQVSFSVPFKDPDMSGPTASIVLSTLRLEYWFTPRDQDLERLLSLITPSKDKYDDDDDILVDTLLRQRRRGAVLRVNIADAQAHVREWKDVEAISGLGDDLGKLSAVTKYLPEDERPGLLVLARVKSLSAELPVNERFGTLHISISDFQAAHIGLPALLALSITDVSVSSPDHGSLVHFLVEPSASENLPMIMARMLGDEIEPTLKIKLFNTRVEYSVPRLIALMNVKIDTTAEEIFTDLAQSVAELVLPEEQQTLKHGGVASNSSNSPSKKMRYNLQLHESAIGLSPERGTSKALLVLTDTKCHISNPSEHAMETQLEMRKAGLFVADVVLTEDSNDVVIRSAPNNTAIKPRMTSTLSKRGFVSVGSIMAASIHLRIEQAQSGQEQAVDVELRNELLLLETCADSTQTLIAILSGLAPPSPPSKQPKYLTEPMTIEDMMASFTGDAFEKPTLPPSTLFDVDEEPEEIFDDPMRALDEPDEDDLLTESEMTSSLYGPVSGILGVEDRTEDADDANAFPETIESLLEDDPFEMTLATDVALTDNALMRELNKQCKPALQPDSINLGVQEFEDLGLDALGGDQNMLGTPYRFNTPASNRRVAKRGSQTQKMPFRLKARDLHIIWNIYDGYDWQRTRESITAAVEQVEMRVEERKAARRHSANEREDEESIIGDFLFNSIYIGVPSGPQAQELRRQINRDIDDLASETESVPMSGMSKPTTVYSASGRPVRSRQKKRLRLERSRTHKIAFELKGVSADVLVYPPDSTDVVSSVDVRVRDLEVFDNVPTSTWRKFLTHLSNEPGDREMSKPMLHLELSNVKTLENFAASEIVIHVTLLPLRLHVDQDALDFITRFFEFKDETAEAPSSSTEQPFIQRLEIETVDLQLDYKPKKVDYAGLRSGHTTEFMNFVILDAANIRLKHAIIYGIRGFEPLHKTLNDIWMPDVKRNQLPTVLAGLAPVRSLVNIGSGIRDVVAIPIREYQKDGRVVRSIQKGAFQFGKTTASELARLGAKVAMGTQTLLQGAEELLSPVAASSSHRPTPVHSRSNDQAWHNIGDDDNDDDHEPRAISAYANQPLGLLSGLRAAQRYLEYDLLTARDALIAVQGEVMDSVGAGGAAAAVARYAPTIILRPIIGTSRAVGTALLGVGNQIDRDNLRRVDDKYKKR